MRLSLFIYDIQIPFSQSLKDKRRVIHGLKMSLRAKLNVSVAEIEFHDKWQRAKLSIAWVAMNEMFSQSIANEIESLINRKTDISIIEIERRFF